MEYNFIPPITTIRRTLLFAKRCQRPTLYVVKYTVLCEERTCSDGQMCKGFVLQQDYNYTALHMFDWPSVAFHYTQTLILHNLLQFFCAPLTTYEINEIFIAYMRMFDVRFSRLPHCAAKMDKK